MSKLHVEQYTQTPLSVKEIYEKNTEIITKLLKIGGNLTVYSKLCSYGEEQYTVEVSFRDRFNRGFYFGSDSTFGLGQASIRRARSKDDGRGFFSTLRYISENISDYNIPILLNKSL